MDGVLVDSERAIESAAIDTLAEYGVRAQPDDFLPFVGAGDGEYIGGAAAKYGLPYKDEMKDRLYEIYLQNIEERIVIFDSVLPLLERLKKQKYITALASSADRIKVDANLKAAGIKKQYFSCIMTGEDVEEKKPSPEIYLKTAEKISLPPAGCVVAEDALNGVKAAKRAGMLCIGVCTSFSAGELKDAGADYSCTDAGWIGNILENINLCK